MTIEELKIKITAFLEETGMKPTPFGLKSVNDGKLYERIFIKNKDLRTGTVERILGFMREYEKEHRKNL